MPVAPQCQPIADEIAALEVERGSLQEMLQNAPPAEKAGIARQIKVITRQLELKQQQLDECVKQHPIVPPLTEGMLVREASKPEVYVIYDGKRVWIPTPDALFIMGHNWADVHVVPDGTLAVLPEARIDSASPTPGSLVFPPQNDPSPPDHGKHFAITRGKYVHPSRFSGERNTHNRAAGLAIS